MRTNFALLRESNLHYPGRALDIWVDDRIYLIEQLRLIPDDHFDKRFQLRTEIKNKVERRYYVLWKPPPDNTSANIWLREAIDLIVLILSRMPRCAHIEEEFENEILGALENDRVSEVSIVNS